MPFAHAPLKSRDDVPPRVLVVDDNVAFAENLSEILELSGYLTAIAETAEQAFDRLASGDIGLLITDCRLPGASGLELIAMIARSVGKIPAIVMSGFLDEAMTEVANHLGALAILPKPLSIEKLMDAVRSTDVPCDAGRLFVTIRRRR